MKYLLLVFVIVSGQVSAQIFNEKEMEAKIKEVTVFLNGAQINRSGKSTIPKGKSILKIKSLSPHIDDKSILVKAKGDFTILSVNHQYDYLNDLKKDEQLSDLENQLEAIDRQLEVNLSKLTVLHEKESLLNANKNLGGRDNGVSLTELKQAIDFFGQETEQIKKGELDIKESDKILNKQKERLQKEIAEVKGKEEFPSSIIEIRVESLSEVQGSFDITYLVGFAGWYPKYDVRVENISQPLQLKYRAEVYQNTGVNWDNVKLKFSNGNPNQSGLAPELQPWKLNYARNTIVNNSFYGVSSGSVGRVSGKVLDEMGQAIPGVNVIVDGTSIGTVTDIDGRYDITLPHGAKELKYTFVGYQPKLIPIQSSAMTVQLEPDNVALEEVVVVGYEVQNKLQGKVMGLMAGNSRKEDSWNWQAESLPTTTIENQTTVEFEVETPYSIKSNGEMLSVDLNTYNIETKFEYFAVPKLDKDAFLVAKITNWDQYNLLEGEANLYFEDAYVGRSILDAKSLSDTLSISLGRDRSIVIGREKIDEFSERKILGSNKVESRSYKLIVRNKKSQAINLTLLDQVPVPVLNDISVTHLELSKGNLEEKTGKITWDMQVEPNSQKELKLIYEVKYPKREKVILE
ncbi:DUF4139 domain-containing protein [Echinicola sp. 20G]|uniref:DUF4139 domain-containing protein n=1 Tax=Echinicola sp. 20G TaxID=2781961 RepID=UPI0019104729|nr:DUF4139 domain-containing protein [Echinicola sp. 20G]